MMSKNNDFSMKRRKIVKIDQIRSGSLVAFQQILAEISRNTSSDGMIILYTKVGPCSFMTINRLPLLGNVRL